MYKPYLKDYQRWKISDKTHLVITTPQTIALCYRDFELRSKIVYQVLDYSVQPPSRINYYHPTSKPFLNHLIGFGIVFSIRWGCVIIDEIQQYNNIETKVCQSLIAVCSNHKWLLSGTIMSEPDPKRVLGYNCILNSPNTPRCLPDTINYIRKKPIKNVRNDLIDSFRGLSVSMVVRKENKMFKPPKVNKKIISHTLSFGEHKIYIAMKSVMLEVAKMARALKHIDPDRARRFSTYKLAMLCYLRQSLICPFIPLASASVDMLDFKRKSALPKIMRTEIEKIGLGGWLNNVENVKSTRIQEVIKAVNRYSKERIVIFISFRTAIDVLKYYISSNRSTLEITSTMSIKKRGQVITEFEQTSNGILLLTYHIGANGLNLQCSNTVFLVDFWWNASKSEQAIARVYRYGQKAPTVNIVYFTSNTALEKIIFEKQKDKLDIIEELMIGGVKTKIRKLKIDDIIKFITLEDNEKLLKGVYY